MPSCHTRLLLALTVVLAVVATSFAPSAAGHPHGPTEDEYTFIGGGWGHGTGMSQYGALGRAEAGFSYAEILAFYYDRAELTTDPAFVSDDVDVRIAVHQSTVFRPTGLLTVEMDGRFLDTTRNTLTVRRVNGGWHINSSNIDWCQGFCSGTDLTVSFNQREIVQVSNTANGTDNYAYGQFQLRPAGSGVANCGNSAANEYCLVIGDMTMQQYLYGLDEMPHRWPLEAQKAQAVAARSYAVAQIVDRRGWAAPFDLYSSTRDQEYRAWDHESEVHPDHPWSDAVNATDDTVLVYRATNEAQPEVITAFYGSANGGHTAANEEPRREPIPYLLAKPDPYDAALDAQGNSQNPFHAWRRTYNTEQISKWLAEYPFADLDVGEIAEIYITDQGPSGRIDDAVVTLVGSERTLEVLNDDGEPFGYRFYYALVLGCRNTPGCMPVLSTKLTISGAHDDEGYNEYTLPFDDVAFDAPYAEAVAWMLNNGLTSGTSPTTFSPLQSISRAQFATFLWRFAGQPEGSEGSLLFADVEPDSYFSSAVGWMVDNSITAGCSSGDVDLFCPDDVVTAPQLAVFLWGFAGKKYSNRPIPFVDIGVNDYFLEASRWMVEHQLWLDEDFEPSDGGPVEFGRNRTSSRARVAAYLWRLAASPGAFADGILPPLIRDL